MMWQGYGIARLERHPLQAALLRAEALCPWGRTPWQTQLPALHPQWCMWALKALMAEF